MNVPGDATATIVHALTTFGSVQKALRWLQKPCRALEGAVPLELLIGGEKNKVEAELDAIDEGAYI